MKPLMVDGWKYTVERDAQGVTAFNEVGRAVAHGKSRGELVAKIRKETKE